jgi:hypothetical protein
MTEDVRRKSVSCVRKAMTRTGSTLEAFFKRAEKAKTAPRNYDRAAELNNFRCLETGENQGSWHELPRFLIAFADEVNAKKRSEIFDQFPPDVLMARCSSGRFTYLANV